jgi:hypothetical protein
MLKKQEEVKRSLSSQEAYLAFSVLIPSSLLFCLDRLLRDVSEFFNNIPWWFILIALACNILASIVLFLLTKSHSDFTSFIRVNFFIYFPVLAVLTLFFYDTPQLLIFSAVLLFLQWILAHYIFNRFKDYWEFMHCVQDYRGSSLGQKLRSYSLLVADSVKSLRSLRKTMYILMMMIFCFTMILLLAGIELKLLSLTACLAFIIITLFFTSRMSIYLDEYRFYTEGIPLPAKFKQKRLAYALIIFFLSILFLFPLLKDRSLFPPAYLLIALNWIIRLFPLINFKIKIPRHLFEENREYSIPETDFNHEYQESPLIKDLTALLNILALVIAGLVILGVLYFLFKPLFKRGIKNLLKGKHPLALIIKKIILAFLLFKKLAREIIQALIELFSPVKKRHSLLAGPGVSPALLKPERIGFKKRLQINRILRAFLVLIKWGKSLKIDFYPTLGPKEYVCLLVNKLPEKSSGLRFIADTFEEAVFSDHLIARATIKTYMYQIKEITAR